MELDHIFICVEHGGEAGDALLDFGVLEGSSNQHPGQGTACRRFFFHNFMLELLWVTDHDELRDCAIERTALSSRFANAGHSASPFGVCFRPSEGEPPPHEAPFKTWPYRPPYLPQGLSIDISERCTLAEPLWFYQVAGQRPDRLIPALQPIEHPCDLREVRRVHLRVPRERSGDGISPAARKAVEAAGVTLAPGEDALLELEFDGCHEFEYHDFRPRLPLVFRW